MDKRSLSERDICTKLHHARPAQSRVGRDAADPRGGELYQGPHHRARGKLVTRGKAKRADYILYYKPNIPIALIEAKDNNHSVGDGMQQALDYAETLKIPIVFSSNAKRSS